MRKAILLLSDGNFYLGTSFGSSGDALGEVCFNTGMTGYQEILTDPSYRKQIVTMTAPHIGNYGVNTDDIESSRVQVAGFVIKEDCAFPSSWRSKGTLSRYLNDKGIVSDRVSTLLIPTIPLSFRYRDNVPFDLQLDG